jgi:prepilin signal peptidase PulO-like enzyme (type II secretory pathway)
MRAYYVPATAGVLLIVSAFLPWMNVGDVALGGVPDVAGWWIFGLGMLAVLLAALSIWTRKNSRHPLLLVGLSAFAIIFLGYQWMARAVRNSAWAQAEARAIVENTPVGAAPDTHIGPGIYLGILSALALVGFGLTIVIKRVPRAYAVSEDDDV